MYIKRKKHISFKFFYNKYIINGDMFVVIVDLNSISYTTQVIIERKKGVITIDNIH